MKQNKKTVMFRINEKIISNINPLSANPRQSRKLVKHTQTICLLLQTTCLSVFDHFVGLSLEGFITFILLSISDMGLGKTLQSICIMASDYYNLMKKYKVS